MYPQLLLRTVPILTFQLLSLQALITILTKTIQIIQTIMSSIVLTMIAVTRAMFMSIC